MDTVSELTARATAYLVLLQDAMAMQPEAVASTNANPDGLPTTDSAAPNDQVARLTATLFSVPALRTKALALVNTAIAAQPPQDKQTTFAQHMRNLLKFLQERKHDAGFDEVLAEAFSATSELPTNKLMQLVQATWQWFAALLGPAPHQPPAGRPSYLPPEQWRRLLRTILYQYPAHLTALADALKYAPILEQPPSKAAAGAAKAKPAAGAPAAASPADSGAPLEQAALNVEQAEAQVEYEWWKSDRAVPFEVVFTRELREINRRRHDFQLPEDVTPDPLRRADNLGLCALAFSGGGIRSATFNLGILQGLASAGWLPRFDYLSTVSGGGYLGSWLVAWIKREGSLNKVADRLCPDKAPLPNAEEVRPIRWLRMYSNYLAPDARPFSTDSWTLGLTWLRNTLLNQLIIILALGALLALGGALLHSWFLLSWTFTPGTWHWWVLGFSLGPLAIAAGLSGLGMRRYHADFPLWNARSIRWVVYGLLFVAMASAYLASGFFHNTQLAKPEFNFTKTPLVSQGFDFATVLLKQKEFSFANVLLKGHEFDYERTLRAEVSFRERFWALLPAGLLALGALLVVAKAGKYDECFYPGKPTRDKPWWKEWAWPVIFLASAGAAAAGQAGLAWGWQVLMAGQLYSPANLPAKATLAQLAACYGPFIIGLPLVLETVVLAVIVRMALLGRNFPDERREWWGRLGAVVHLAVVGWLIITSSTLLVKEVIEAVANAPGGWEARLGIVFGGLGSWLALIGRAVYRAFSARTPAQPGASTWLDKLLSVAPYAFGLGLLLLTTAAVQWLIRYLPVPDWLSWADAEQPYSVNCDGLLAIRAVLLCVVLFLLAWGLGYRVGVNEFSLHHFYRNRLVRAYLGASRPRVERQRTANPFTSFDGKDDVKLCRLRREAVPDSPEEREDRRRYNGPYLLINTTLNATKVTDLAQQNRMAESFVFTPYYCGFDVARLRAVNPQEPTFDYGYRATEEFAYEDHGPALGTAMAISGAAASPNEGYHSSPAMAFLLTLFNVRLGWWMGNPASEKHWKYADPSLGLLYLLKDLLGRSDTSDKFVNLSDGGHFDNMGLYELVRRRCRYIVLGDGEEDHLFNCDGLANAIRRCRVDFGVEIAIDVTPITTRKEGYSQRQYAVGTIQYPEDAPGKPSGYLLYLKASLKNEEPTDVREYAQSNRAFPHQSTGDQFFDEAQFESYRRLGLHIFETLARENALVRDPSASLDSVFEQIETTCQAKATASASH